ncbi:hypothetical protein GH714_002460 [Hevea brasiliensis]|uniref:Synaptonemal complex protein 1 n=1 Tax=Hevea brasiliensis TaxID=3981 RepID=A0A6A6LE28_HEVBR|nr:hypothetical protein GH714_002460 [Hevea brasiliensis]
MKSLDQFKSLSGPVSGSAKNLSFSSRSSSDSFSSGSFANLKLTAEKLIKEQASVKTDLEIANSKLKKSMEHIGALEEKLQYAFNENAKLKVKQKEDEKLWKGLESKFSSTKTLCDQLTETLQHLAGQVQGAEKDKEFFEGKLSASSNAIENLNQQMNELSLKLDSAEETIRTQKQELEELKIEKEEKNKIYKEEKSKTATLIEEKVQLEKDLAAKCAQKQYDQLHDKFLSILSEKDALLLVNLELNSKIIELQKAQETVMAQLSEECRVAGERIQKLESEAELLLSKKNEAEVLVSKLEETIGTLSESSRSSENTVVCICSFIIKLGLGMLCSYSNPNFSNLEARFIAENFNIRNGKQYICQKLEAEERKNAEDIASWQKESEKQQQHIDSLEKQIAQLHSILEAKEQLLLQYKNREKKFEDQVTESQALLTAAESKLAEAKRQHDLMLESKQLELSRHLKEISQRNDKAINDIKKKYEVEKLEIVNMEKEKADKVVQEMQTKCDQTLAECKEESRQQLVRIQEEHASLVLRIQQEHDRKEMCLKADHIEELKRAHLQAENELREEDRQRALLQLQWKVMSDKPQGDQEVTSKKDYSISSIKMRGASGGKRSQPAPDLPFPGGTQTPVSKLLKKVENANTGSVMSIPKHHKKVTHREYEVETANGRTITKRRKTKSTVMFEDRRKHKKINTPKIITPRSVAKGIKGGGRPHPSNIGDLFSEGSLNPYADDPYAFD